jgi:hypothetical protein
MKAGRVQTTQGFEDKDFGPTTMEDPPVEGCQAIKAVF